MSFGEIPMPTSEHAGPILVGAWPSQSEVAWGGFHMELSARGRAIAGQYDTQFEIRQGVQNMSGSFIEAAVGVIQRRAATLDNRCDAYKKAATAAKAIASQILGLEIEDGRERFGR